MSAVCGCCESKSLKQMKMRDGRAQKQKKRGREKNNEGKEGSLRSPAIREGE